MKLPQLHLRDLFWLVLVVALAVGWWVNYRQLSLLLRELSDAKYKAANLDELTAELHAKGIDWTIFDKKGLTVWSTTDAPLPADVGPRNALLPKRQLAPPVGADPFGAEP